MEIISETAIECWNKALTLIFDQGTELVDQNKRVCKIINNLLITINSVDDIEEPIDKIQELNEFVYPSKEELRNTILDKISSSGYDYAYGSRLFNYRQIKNQMDDYIIPTLKNDQNTRRAIAIIYDPLNDSIRKKDAVPGLISIHFSIIKGKLNVCMIVRSNDIFIGWPANIYHGKVLQKYICDKLKLLPGKITTFSISAHVFQENFECIKKIISN